MNDLLHDFMDDLPPEFDLPLQGLATNLPLGRMLEAWLDLLNAYNDMLGKMRDGPGGWGMPPNAVMCCGPTQRPEAARIFTTVGIAPELCTSSDYSIYCGTPLQVPSHYEGEDLVADPVPDGQYNHIYRICIGPTSLDGDRFTYEEVWRIPRYGKFDYLPQIPYVPGIPGAIVLPDQDSPNPLALPSPWPSDATPIGQPTDLPHPPPFRFTPTGPGIGQPWRNRPAPGFGRPPRLRRRRNAPPYQRPSDNTEATPGGGVGTAPPGHNQTPPGRRTKEAKGKTSFLGARALKGALSAITEYVDILEAAHDALPKKYQCGGLVTAKGRTNVKAYGPTHNRFGGTSKPTCTPQRKAEALYTHIQHMDVDKFIANLVYEHLEDKFFGTLGKASGQVGRDNNWLVGLQTGFGM